MTTPPYYTQPTAVMPTEHEAAEEAQIAFQIEQQVKRAIRKGREALWELAEALYEFDEARGWQALGHEHLNEWLADNEIGIPRATYYRYVRTWRKLVVERQIDAARLRQLDQSKVAEVVDKIAAAEVTVDEALDDVEAMGWRDLHERYRAQKTPSAGTREPEAEALDDTLEPLGGDALDEIRAYEAQMDAEGEDEVLSGEVVDPIEPSGPIVRGEAAEVRAEAIRELRQSQGWKSARDDVDRAIERMNTHGDTFPAVAGRSLLMLARLIDLAEQL